MSEQPVRVKSPFGDDLLFSRMNGYEELGRLYRYELELLSPKENLALDDLLGKDLTVEFDLPDDKTRYFHGFVTEFSQTGGRGRYVTYSAVVHPWFWFLTRTSDCRIFQDKTVPDIIKEVFRDLGLTDFKDSLSAEYRKWEYCVQYRETDFNFISRLMEQEGIYYFFEHEDGKHTLVLADAYGAHSPLPNYEEIPYYPPTEMRGAEHIHDWQLSKSVRTGTCAIGAFHFIKPKANLEVTSSIVHPHDHESYEIYDYPGEYYERGEGDRYVGVRMEEIACDYERVRGDSTARGIFPGGMFDLTQYPRDDQNREYLVVSAQHSLSLGDYESSGAAGLKYGCSFEAMYSQDPFRTARTTPKPVVQGPQTAIVVGKKGEEIWTDEYGRIKVQFHWDRYGKKDENSSCWVRVSQSWAGGQWGGMSIPRMGQEVVVDFIEGDPDRPIVTGRVYNKDNMPPYKLPDDKTKSTLKSRSSKGASADNFNEIRFEDLKDSEEIYIHAEKDHNTVIENNQTIKVGFDKKDDGDRTEAIHRDRSLQVGRDKKEKIDRNKSILVKADHNETISSNMSVMVGANLSESVAINYSETVGAAMELSVGGLMAVTVGAALTETVGGAKAETIGLAKSENIGANKSLDVGSSLNESIGTDRIIEIGKDLNETIGGKQNKSVEKEFIVKAKKIQLVAQDEVNIKSGKAEIILKKNGDISIKGKKINVKGSGDVIIKGSKIKEN
jgi:type VI secretion system secreted protein VgrG